jgi:hypothetical protein
VCEVVEEKKEVMGYVSMKRMEKNYDVEPSRWP